MQDHAPQETLRRFNGERLNNLHQTPIVAVAFDVHGFTLGRDESLNRDILDQEARLLAEGCFLAAVTGYGDRIHLAQTRPLRDRLVVAGLNPLTVPFFLSTRNGAITEHGFTGEVIAHDPISDEMYEAITTHKLVQAIETLTRDEVKAGLQADYEDTQAKLGFELHPRRGDFPGIRHDWHPTTRQGYQLTLIYEPHHIDNISPVDSRRHQAVQVIRDYAGGLLPSTPQELALIVKTRLQESGVNISTNTAASHPEIDMAMPGVDKSRGCLVLEPFIAAHWGISTQEAVSRTIGGGDSPTQNDRPLVERFGFGVTNIDYWLGGENGPIVLDYQGISDPVSRTREMFQRIQVLGR